MSGIASKNLYDLLGNDPDQDPDRAPSPPTKAVDKPLARTGKRNAAAEAPGATAGGAVGGRGGRSDGLGGNNRSDDATRGDRPSNRTRDAEGGRGRGRGGRGGRGGEYRGNRTARDDRHSRTGVSDHDKQVAAGWGGETGQSEWADEKAGADIATAEVKNDAGFTPDTSAADPAFGTGPDGIVGGADVAAAPEEPEDNSKSYAEYLEELKSKRAGLSSTLEIRKANEGTKQKFPEGKAVNYEEQEYFAGAGAKQSRQKENKSKNVLTMDGNYYAAPAESRDGGRGGRGGARGRGEGGRGGRGGDRGDRGDRGGRGRGEGFRGGRGEGRGRGEGFRGGRGGARGDFSNGNSRGASINVTDESAFPSLG